jgi:hypothetical protein
VVAPDGGARRLALARGIAAGLYLVRLAQDGEARVAKAVVLD